MKKLYLFFSILTALLLSSGKIYAQCPNNNEIIRTFGAPTTVGASVGNDICIFAGEGFRLINLQAGSVYRISACNSDPGLDTRLTVYPVGGGSALAFNDDYCGLLSRLDFTSIDGQPIDILLDATGPNNTCVSDQNYCGYVVITLISSSGNPEYCIPHYASPIGGTSNGDFINGVNLGTINNQNTGLEGGPNYTNYASSLLTNLQPNTQYTLTIKNNPDFSEKVAAWIDYNQDLEFSSNERLGQITIFPGASGTITFTTPANVKSGSTRLRVRMMNTIPFGVYMDPCGLATYGETEDYGIVFPTSPAGPSDGLNFTTQCGLNISIPDNTCPNNTEASVTVSGLSNLGEDHVIESVSIIIEHPMAADLDIYLKAPDGRIIELSTDNGGAGANYGIPSEQCEQVAKFKMNASQPVTGATAPIVGSFIPEGNLNSLNNGLNPNGIWKLFVCDDFAGDVGSIRYFAVEFKENTQTGNPPSCAATYTIADQATDVDKNTQLSWTAGDGTPTAYDVYFGTNQNPALVSDNQTGTSYDPGTMLAGTTYYYMIVPKNAHGSASGCAVRSFTTAEDLPQIPGCAQNFGPANLSQNISVDTSLSWAAGNGSVPNTYSVYFGTERSNLAPLAINITETYYDFQQALSYNTTYYYLIVPKNAGGEALNCDTLSFTTESEPIVQQGILMHNGTITACDTSFYDSGGSNGDYDSGEQYVLTIAPSQPNSNLKVTFDSYSFEVNGLDRLAIYNGTTVTNTPLAILSGNSNGSVSYTSTAPGGELTFAFVSDDFVNASGWSATLSCEAQLFTPECASNQLPANQATDVSPGTTLSWTAGAGNPTGYNVYFGTDDNNLPQVASNIQQTSYSFNNTLELNTTYFWRVEPINQNGVKDDCTIHSFTTSNELSFPMTNGSVHTCSGVFYDSGGKNGNYGNNEYNIFVIHPSTPGSQVQVNFTSFDLSQSSLFELDMLMVINGGDPKNGGDLIGTYTGTTNPGTITSTANDGALTFLFISDANNNSTGWAANISCVTSNNPPACTINRTPANEAENVSLNASLLWMPGTGPITNTYTVLFGTNPNNLQTVAEDITLTQYTPQGLLPNTTYYWSVIPKNVAGSAIDCDVFSFTTGAETVECAQNFSPANGTQGVGTEAILSWEPASNNIVAYDVFLGQDPFNLTKVSENLAQTSYLATNLNPGTIYYWQIIPKTQDGSAANCTINSFLTQGNQEVLCAENFSPADQAVDVDLNVTLSWTPGTQGGGPPGPPVPIFLSYDVYFGTDPGNLVLVSHDQFENTYQPGPLQPQTTYYWLIVPSEEGNLATGCDTLSFTTTDGQEHVSCVIKPEPANGATNVSMSTTEIAWSIGMGAEPEHFDVYFGTDPDNLPLLSKAQTDNNFETGLLDEGTTYYWKVIAYNANDTAQNCETFSFTMIDSPECAQGFSPANEATDVSTGTSLSWNAVSSASSYNVYFGTDENNLTLVSEDQPGTSYNPAPLNFNTQYFWKVVPVNEVGEATGCAVTSFTTEEESTPTELTMFEGQLTTCSDTLFDTGGSTGNYSDDEFITMTLYPATPNSKVKLNFLAFNTENGWDSLYVYNGPVASGMPALELTGEIVPSQLPHITSNAPDGSLTLVFRSDDTGTRSGFKIAISCFTPTEVPSCANNMSPADGATDQDIDLTLSWTAGDGNPSGYDVYMGNDPDHMTPVSVNQSGTNYSPDLDPNTTYYWQVVPRNGFGSAEQCAVYAFTTGAEEPSNEIIMHTGEVTTCDATFFDDGGPNSNYSAGKQQVLTIYPATPGHMVRVTFNSFASELNYDYLAIFYGNTVGNTADATLTGENMNMPVSFTSNAQDGSITFKWNSDVSLTKAGWNASVTCVDPQAALGCVQNSSPADGSNNISNSFAQLNWLAGEGIPTGYSVYFGTDPDNLNLVSENQQGTQYAPGTLTPSTTYFWKIVPLNENDTLSNCPVNSFTTSSSIDITMSNGSINTCDANFYDSGGPFNNYGLNEDSVLTICPDAPNKAIRVTFNSFLTESDLFDPTEFYDYLMIYDGNSTAATAFINPATGDDMFGGTYGPGTITATNDDGCLTFAFSSDYLINRAGWSAKINCVATDEVPACAIINHPQEGATEVCRNVTLSWASDPSSIVTGYDVYFDSGNGLELVSDDQVGTTYNAGFLDANTEYSFKIIPFNNNGEAVDCDAITFTTGTCVTYCEAGVTGEDFCYEHISNVTVGDDINNSSACPADESGYSDYTAKTANLYIGISTSITVTNGEAYQSDSCRVWIDWNQDGDFDDANETIELNGQPFGPYNGSIVPPADALTGKTRMRVRITDAAVDPLTSCGLTIYGETEDYSIIVHEAPNCPPPTNIVAADITKESAALTWNAVNNADSYAIRYREINEPMTVSTWAQPMVVSGQNTFTVIEALEACKDYVLQAATDCGDGEDLFFSSNIYFSTHCLSCPQGATAEIENCGENINGGCLLDPAAYQPIACGETICGSTQYDGMTRDTDWFSFTVTEEASYTFNLTAEFKGSLLIVDVADCDDVKIITQGPEFTANTPYTLASNLLPGSYAIFVAPSFDSNPIACGNKNLYQFTFNGGAHTEIAPVEPVCVTAAPFNLFAIPSGGTWSGTGITNAQDGTFDPSVSGVGTFVITYNASNNACASSATVEITVTGNTAVAPESPTGPALLCAGETGSQFTTTALNGISEYLWVLTPSEAGSISGTGNSATVTWANGFSGTASVVVAAQSACGLSDFSASKDVVVTSAPAAPAAIEGPATSCAGSQNYFSPGSGNATLSWTLNPESAGTIEGTTNTVTVTWGENFSGHATLSVSATNSCGTSNATSIEINVLKPPFVDFVGLAAEYCSSDAPAHLTGIPAGGYFTISGGNGITGNVFDPSQAGAGQYTITYYNQVDGCLGSISQNVKVITGPSVSITAVQDVCHNGAAVTLNASPSGGSFSGPGVNGNTFNPAAVNPGSVTISYSVTDPENECSGTAKTNFIVNPEPIVSLVANNTSVCVNAGAVILTGVPSPGTYEGSGVSGNLFNPSVAGIGNHTVRYTVNNGTCSSTDSVTIAVTNIPELSISNIPTSICTEDGVIQLSSQPSGATFSGPGVIGSTFNPKLAGLGNHTITATLSNEGCTSTATRMVAVNRSPLASFNISAPGYTLNINNTSMYADSYLWDFGDSTTSNAANPSHTYTANGFYTVRLIASNALCGSDTFAVNIDISVGLGEVEGVDQLQVFPNPTTGLVNLVFNATEMQNFEIRILDATGRLIQTESLGNHFGKFNRQYDLSDKAKGMYFFSISSDKGMMNYRIVKD